MEANIERLLAVRPLDKRAIRQIAQATCGQSHNDNWKHLRKRVLTASNYSRALCADGSAVDTAEFVKNHFRQFPTMPAMQYGIDNEANARREYAELYHFEVIPTGLWLRPSGNTGASPDGLVKEDKNDLEPTGVLEIKCPYSMRDKSQHDLFEYAEKHHREHLDQVQGQMAATGLDWCDLVYWSPSGFWRKRIRFNYAWVSQSQLALERFYLKSMKPEIDKRMKGVQIVNFNCATQVFMCAL